jgi:hypothetical protein
MKTKSNLYKRTAEYKERQRNYAHQKRRARGVRPKTKELGRMLAETYLQTDDSKKKAADFQRNAGEAHKSALVWQVISPSGIIYRFKNLSLFVRANRSIFSEDDLAMVGNSRYTKIEIAIRKLSPRMKNPREVSRGWRWYIHGDHHQTFLSVLAIPA